jgi:hypothetical protein
MVSLYMIRKYLGTTDGGSDRRSQVGVVVTSPDAKDGDGAFLHIAYLNKSSVTVTVTGGHSPALDTL